ncbi:hypothetical protein NGUA38_00067 [Salmonella enterica]|nr:hypothetical protein NGUA38_00067 [Salmonella enterica]
MQSMFILLIPKFLCSHKNNPTASGMLFLGLSLQEIMQKI